MGAIEILYKLKHGELPDERPSDAKDCTSHSFGDWERVEHDNEWDDGTTDYFDWHHETETVAVKYDRDGDGGVSERNPTIVPYSDVAEIWCNLSGQQYFLIHAKRKHERECHCGERQTTYKTVKYVAFHCGEIIAEEDDRDHLDQVLIEHDKQF